MSDIQWLVTGCGRSGTVFMAKLLTKLGIPCGHEMIFDHEPWYKSVNRWKNPQIRKLSHCSTHAVKNQNEKLPDWVDPTKTIAESSYLMVPHLDQSLLQNIPLIHIMRNPLEVVSSFVFKLNYFNKKHPDHGNPFNHLHWEDRIYEFLPKLKEIKTQIERACNYYLEWNDRIAQEHNRRPYLLIATENIEKNPNFFKFIKVPEQYVEIDNSINSFGNKRKLSIDILPKGEIRDSFESIVETHKNLVSV